MGRKRSITGSWPLAALAFLLPLTPAEAGLEACNRTSYVLYAAAAALKLPDFTLKGWTRLLPGSCAEVVAGDLTADAYYLSARSSRAHSGTPRAWSGPTTLCVKDKDFVLHQSLGARCPADAFELGFAQVDTHHMRNWSATFRESPDFPAMAAAAKAGQRRLLADLGQRDTGDDKTLAASLAAFKSRLHISAKASDNALFGALETAAMKSAVPAGYTLCNDTPSEVYAAIGQQNAKGFVSRGWWTVAGGACSHLITEPLAGQKIWLRVERGKGAALVGGPNGFCVTGIEFDIQGRQDCKKRGLMEAGFAETNQKGSSGFVSRITANGLR